MKFGVVTIPSSYVHDNKKLMKWFIDSQFNDISIKLSNKIGGQCKIS